MVLAEFTRVLEQYKGQIDDATYWRYKGGRLPRLLRWLAERPDLVEALAEDARALATRSNPKGGDA